LAHETMNAQSRIFISSVKTESATEQRALPTGKTMRKRLG
jgi:hypothetical protein